MAYETDVLIIGAGPTGSTTALALANCGVRCHIVSRGNWMADSPRAHITNQRANEVFRDLGISEDVARYASPWELMGDTTFTTSLAGLELLRMRTWGTGDDRRGDYLRASPCGMVDIIQPLLEPILFQKAAEKGATFAFNTEYVRHEQDSDGVTTTLRDRLDEREFTIRARYMVGADGAKSSVVEHLDLPIEGRMARAGTVYTIFNADLSRYSKHRPSILNWIVTPDASFGEIGMGLLRAVRPWTQWIAGWGFDINKGDPDLSEKNVREKIRVLIGDPAIDPDIVRTSVWYINQAHATQYSKGRVFCGGVEFPWTPLSHDRMFVVPGDAGSGDRLGAGGGRCDGGSLRVHTVDRHLRDDRIRGGRFGGASETWRLARPSRDGCAHCACGHDASADRLLAE